MIKLRDVDKYIDSRFQRTFILKGVNMEVGQGEFLTIMGPSGAGKSTLMNIIGMLDEPSAGEYFFFDEPVHRMKEKQKSEMHKNYIGFIFQVYNLIPSLTAEENVRLVTDIADDPMPAAEALDLVGLADRRDHYPAQLSGGEQQRVAVARAVAKQPGVLLCDEPTGALDSATGVRVLETLARANRQLGTTLVIITHNAGIAAMADRVLHFLDGRIARQETNDTPIEPGAIRW